MIPNVFVPYANEIRVVRKATYEASTARAHLSEVSAQLTMLGVLEAQLDSHGEARFADLLDDNLINRLSEHWSSLRDLHVARVAHDNAEVIRARRAQLVLARQVLRPLAESLDNHEHELHVMQHKQMDALRDPRYADVMALVTEWSTERNEVMASLQRLSILLPRLAPGLELLNNAHRELLEHRGLASEATDEADAYFHARFALSIVGTLFGVLQDMDLGNYTTAVQQLPDKQDERSRQELLRPLHTLEEAIGVLKQRMTVDEADLSKRHRDLHERLDEINARMLDLMG